MLKLKSNGRNGESYKWRSRKECDTYHTNRSTRLES